MRFTSVLTDVQLWLEAEWAELGEVAVMQQPNISDLISSEPESEPSTGHH